MNDTTSGRSLSFEELRAEVQKLPPAERLAFADTIMSELAPAESELDTLWLEEVRDRMAAVHKGELGLVPADDVFARLARK